jgi:hypothetical protein
MPPSLNDVDYDLSLIIHHMQKKISYLAVFVLSIVFLATACSKGDTGPAGTTGATGAQGAAGPTGPQGNANVFTDTFSLASADWLWNSQYVYSTSSGGYTEYFTRYHDVTFSKVTQGLLDSGMVMVYMVPNATDTNQWAPLPYTFLAFGGAYYYNYVYETMPGKVRLHYFYTANGSGTTPTTLSTDVIPTQKYKIVAVTGTVSTAMRRDQVDSTNYKAVMNYLGM